MILYITLFVITLIIASYIKPVEYNAGFKGYITRQGVVNRICLGALFTLLFAVSAFRINTGNDYEMYINKFHDAYYDYYVVTEVGFNYIVKCIYMLFSGEWFVIVFATFAFFTIAIFLKAIYDLSEEFKLTFFLFMAFGFYYQSLNTIRYYLALAIVLYAMKFVMAKKYLRFIILAIIAALFHKTAIIVIPLYILATINWKRWHLIIMAVLSLSGLVFSDWYLKIMLYLYPSYLEETEYINAGTVSIFNIIKCALIIIFALVFYKEAIKDNSKNKFYLYLNIGALALYTCFSFVPFLSRIGYYLTISQILLIPAVLKGIGDEKKRKICRLLVVVAGIGYFALFLLKASDITIKILPYSTWLTRAFEVLPVDKIF